MVPWLCLAALPSENPYRLVWADEFSRAGVPDPNNWTFEEGFVRNQELQWYQPQNARVEKGHLVIEARRERVRNPRYVDGSTDWRLSREYADYTSAALETRGLQEWRFGRFEVRARIDARPGLWPAIWTLGVQDPWPRCGEIDLMEFYREMILANTCWADGTWITRRVPLKTFLSKDPDWSAKWHVWRMDWDPTFLRIYLDDRLMNETDLSKTLNRDGTNPFHQPHFLLLNLAIGSAGGNPTATAFPARFEVDYVRVFEKREKPRTY